MAKALTFAGGAFSSMHERLVGAESIASIDWSALSPDRIEPALLSQARATWQERVTTEYRSAQLMNRLLMDTLAAGDPFDVHAGIVELISDELRHVALCAGVVRALGATPQLPEPLEVKQPDNFNRMSPAQRALSIAINMLIVNETLSVGYIQDLAARCDGPVIQQVLRLTLEDEAEHDVFGVQYVKQALSRFPIATLSQWRAIAAQSYAAQRAWSDKVIADIPVADRSIDAFPDRELIALGLFSQRRQALLFARNFAATLKPLLQQLDLWSE